MSGLLIPLAILCAAASGLVLIHALRGLGRPSRRIQKRLDQD